MVIPRWAICQQGKAKGKFLMNFIGETGSSQHFSFVIVRALHNLKKKDDIYYLLYTIHVLIYTSEHTKKSDFMAHFSGLSVGPSAGEVMIAPHGIITMISLIFGTLCYSSFGKSSIWLQPWPCKIGQFSILFLDRILSFFQIVQKKIQKIQKRIEFNPKIGQKTIRKK